MTMQCPACRQEDLPPSSRFCMACGAALVRLPGDAEPSSGSRASYTPSHLGRDIFLTRTALEGERKHVAVLFADVAGSLRMAHSLDPEVIHQLMNGFFEIALEAVHGQQGTINQFRGDGFMALFGAPRSRGNEELRAVRAAATLRDTVAAYREEVESRFRVPFLVRMGIHCGTVWVGSIGTDLRRDYTAEGPVVGLAARLEEAAEPGQILVSGAVARGVERHVALDDRGTQHFRGVAAPTSVAAVQAVLAVETRLDAERAHGLSGFVGREGELRRLVRHFAAVPEGAASWLELRGDPGCGKSRLAYEHRCARAEAGQTWLEGRCRESEAAHAYAVWNDLLARWSELECVAASVEKTRRLLAGDEGPLAPEAMADAVRSLFDEAFDGQPACLLFEDVQWLDPSSRRLIAVLLREPSAGGLHLLVTSRSGAGVGFQGEGPGVRIELGPLEDSGAREIAKAILGEAPEAEPLVALAVARAQGNPLFAEEVARSLRDGADDLRDAARLEMAWRRAPARVPETLEGVIASRIDALDDSAKRLLQTAAVIGRPFGDTLLAAVEPEAGGTTPTLLGSLVEAGLLVRQGDEIDFHHELCRQVAYRQILVERRRALHSRCAEVLTAETDRPAVARVSEIGFHWDQAGEVVPAVDHLQRAGRLYLDRLAAAEAVLHLRRAWELLSELDDAEPGDRARVGLALVGALNMLDRAGEGAAVLDALDGEALAGAERESLATACIQSGWVRFSEFGDLAAGRRQIEQGIALVDSDQQSARIAGTGHSYLVRLLHLDGSIDAAVAHARRVAELGTGAGDRLGVVLGRGNEGFVRCDAGDVQEALAHCEEAAALADEARNDVAIGVAQAWLAKARLFAGDPDGARAAARRAAQAGEASGQVSAVFNAHHWEAEAWLLVGETRRAVEAFAAMAAIDARWPAALLGRARSELETGDFGEAGRLALTCIEQRPPRFILARALRLLGAAEGLAGRAVEGEERLQASISLCDDLGLRPHVAEAQRFLAELHAGRGDGERARYFSQRASREWAACGMALHAELAEREFASL